MLPRKGTMQFLPELREFLHDNGEIYTVRKYRMSNSHVIIKGLEGTYQRTSLGKVGILDLVPYVEKSGFNDIQSWVKKIKTFIPNLLDPWYLYHITKEEDSEHLP